MTVSATARYTTALRSCAGSSRCRAWRPCRPPCTAWRPSAWWPGPAPASCAFLTRRRSAGQDLPAYQTVQAQLPAWRTWMPAPRRLLRWLAREGTPGLCATAAGVLLRCLWSKGRRCVSGGRVAARWIASGFGVAERTVHRALDALQACGWLARLPSRTPADAAQERRYGARTVINLRWDPPVPDTVASPPTAAAATATVRPRTGRSTAGASGQDQAVKQRVTQGDFVEHAVKHAAMLDQNVSPLPAILTKICHPPPRCLCRFRLENHSDSTPSSGTDFYPFQEETPNPVPALSRARAKRKRPWDFAQRPRRRPRSTCTPDSTGHGPLHPRACGAVCGRAGRRCPCAMPVEMPPTMPADIPLWPCSSNLCGRPQCRRPPLAPVPPPAARAPRADPAALFAALPAAVQEEHLRAATARLLARGFAAACFIRPALLANVYTHLASSSAAPGPTSPASAVPAPAGPGPAALCPVQTPAASASPAPAPGSPRGSAPALRPT